MWNFYGITLTLFLVIDALGNIPVYLALLKPFDKKKRLLISIRELLFALIIMVIFHYLGEILLKELHVSGSTVQIAGGTILFLIAMRLIFAQEERASQWGEQPPFIFPIATPIIAGPSVLAAIMIFAQDKGSDLVILGAIFFSWLFSSFVLLLAKPIRKLLTDKGLLAFQRLIGLIVAIIAVELFLEGVKELVR